jgi:2-oxoglutarate ferredoxin oxidoreductase subunit alpha
LGAARQVDTVLVAEMNRGQLVREVERAATGEARIESLLRADGEPILPGELLERLVEAVPAGGGAA